MTPVTRFDSAGALRHLRKADPGLVPLIKQHGPPTLTPTRDPVMSLGRAIIYQQLSGSAASTIYGRFVALFGGTGFPKAEALAAMPVEQLRTAGLSGAKAAALRDLATHVVDGRLRPRALSKMSDEEIAAALLPVRGIGPWSVDMFLMFALCRPDVLPLGDLGVRKGMQRHFKLRKLPEPAKMTKLAEPWRPWRSVGAWYMWRVLET
jgi:DNA-3-methyladenine glycosylase II